MLPAYRDKGMIYEASVLKYLDDEETFDFKMSDAQFKSIQI